LSGSESSGFNRWVAQWKFRLGFKADTEALFSPGRYNDLHMHKQGRSTRALIKFCEEHHYPPDELREMKVCLRWLTLGSIKRAVEGYNRISIRRSGSLSDWQPPVVFDYETPEYAQAVFEALTTQWELLMKLSLPKSE